MFKQFICFTGVGAIGTLAHNCVLVAFVEMLAIDPVIGSISGFIVGAVVIYILKYHFTFKSNAWHNETGPKFFLYQLVCGVFPGKYTGTQLYPLSNYFYRPSAVLELFCI